VRLWHKDLAGALFRVFTEVLMLLMLLVISLIIVAFFVKVWIGVARVESGKDWRTGKDLED
jgi:competence protein ComGC